MLTHHDFCETANLYCKHYPKLTLDPFSFWSTAIFFQSLTHCCTLALIPTWWNSSRSSFLASIHSNMPMRLSTTFPLHHSLFFHLPSEKHLHTLLPKGSNDHSESHQIKCLETFFGPIGTSWGKDLMQKLDNPSCSIPSGRNDQSQGGKRHSRQAPLPFKHLCIAYGICRQ